MAKTKPVSLKDILPEYQNSLFNRQKYIKNEFQAFGLELAKELHDWDNRSLYIRLAKQIPRHLLESARYFVKDQTTGTIKNRARLFMWKLKELKAKDKV
ncbi:MAG: hypothetical protein WC686_03645 [Candidatus Shapirobacteria bacterium]|jgi:hypothetical protein